VTKNQVLSFIPAAAIDIEIHGNIKSYGMYPTGTQSCSRAAFDFHKLYAYDG
jgi:hypothetical protein